MSETLPKLDALWRDYCDDFGLPSWGDVIQWLVDMPRVSDSRLALSPGAGWGEVVAELKVDHPEMRAWTIDGDCDGGLIGLDGFVICVEQKDSVGTWQRVDGFSEHTFDLLVKPDDAEFEEWEREARLWLPRVAMVAWLSGQFPASDPVDSTHDVS